MITQYKVMVMATCMTGFHIVGTAKSACLCVDSVYTVVCVCVCVRSYACVIAGSTLTADVLPYESVSATLLMSANLPGSRAPILARRREAEERRGWT